MKILVLSLGLLLAAPAWCWTIMISNSGDSECPTECLFTLQGNRGESFTFRVSTRNPATISSAEVSSIDAVLRSAGYEERFEEIWPSATVLDNVSNTTP